MLAFNVGILVYKCVSFVISMFFTSSLLIPSHMIVKFNIVIKVLIQCTNFIITITFWYLYDAFLRVLFVYV